MHNVYVLSRRLDDLRTHRFMDFPDITYIPLSKVYLRTNGAHYTLKYHVAIDMKWLFINFQLLLICWIFRSNYTLNVIRNAFYYVLFVVVCVIVFFRSMASWCNDLRPTDVHGRTSATPRQGAELNTPHTLKSQSKSRKTGPGKCKTIETTHTHTSEHISGQKPFKQWGIVYHV